MYPRVIHISTTIIASPHADAEAAASASSALKHLSVQVNSDGIAVVKIDVQGAKVNTLGTNLAAEFDAVLNQVVCQDGAFVGGSFFSQFFGISLLLFVQRRIHFVLVESKGVGSQHPSCCVHLRQEG